MTRSQPLTPGRGVLADSLIELAGTDDDDPAVGVLLTTIVQLAADLLDPVAFTSVTREYESRYSTVAVSSALALAVDEAQYADSAGPCLDALDSGAPTSVPRIDTTMSWPGFRDAAYQLGLRSSLSIPLFAGRGLPTAALNLYGHDPATMAPLSAAVLTTFDDSDLGRTTDPPEELGPGAGELVAGLAGAFAVRATIQQAIGMIIAERQTNADLAYGLLRSLTAATKASLVEVAMAVIAGDSR